MKVTVKDLSGNDQADLEVRFAVIENGKGTQAVHDVVVAHRAAARSGTACTKTMGEVAGSGKKPWRQKGTGRARAGSFQSPLWRGGGVVFGPKPRDYRKKVTKSVRRLALRKAMSERLKAGDVLVVEELRCEQPKTKAFVELLRGLGLDTQTTLVVTPEVDRTLQLASRNLRWTELTTASDLNTYQVLKFDKLLFSRTSFEKFQERLLPSTTEA